LQRRDASFALAIWRPSDFQLCFVIDPPVGANVGTRDEVFAGVATDFKPHIATAVGFGPGLALWHAVAPLNRSLSAFVIAQQHSATHDKSDKMS
jgi:hypothetical protein